MNDEKRTPHYRVPRLRSRAALACALWLFTFAAMAAEPMIMSSASKQFIVRGRPQTSVFARNANTDLVYIDPALLVVTCERVKQTVARELGWGKTWRGTIFVDVRSMKFDNQEPRLVPFRATDGWRYRLEVPDEISRRRLVESIVEALLIEFADRGATDYSVELPPWLVEGFAAHLMSGDLADLALQPNAMNVRHRAHNDPVAPLRERVQATGAISIDQLNWADFDQSDPQRAEAYRFSSHLFVRELLRLRGGPDAMSAMLAMLPEHLNWQTAFLRGFEPHFRRMVDVEKWWALSIVQLKTRESSVHWSAVEAQRKVEDILLTPVQAPLAGDVSPQVKPVTLQTVVSDWDFKQQQPLLQTKLGQLQLARVRLTPEMVAVVDGYRAAIGKYLQARRRPGRFFRERNIGTAVTLAIEDFNALDQQRAKVSNKNLTADVATKALLAVREADQRLADGITELPPKVVPLTPP